MDRPLIPLLDLTRQTGKILPELQKSFRRVLLSGSYVLGSEVAAFESEFAKLCGVLHAVGVASGTDALELSLRACGVGQGDIVATVSFTFIATADAILHVGATPLFVDIDPITYTMDPADLERRIAALNSAQKRRLKAVIPVHLYGHPCAMDRILRIARRRRLKVIEDAAQAAGARWKGKPVGSLGDAGCFSFFPTKNLGGFGDGGIITTRSAALAARLRLLRVHGRRDRQFQLILGRNSRLDELQAALLRVKLRRLAGWVARRRAIAHRMNRTLSKIHGIKTPVESKGARHAYHLYVIRCAGRDRLQKALARAGIGSAVYYSAPAHRQPLHLRKNSRVPLPETDRAAREVLALPLYPELSSAEIRRILRAVQSSF